MIDGHMHLEYGDLSVEYILEFVNEAVKKADDMMAEGMGAITGGLNIPGLF